MNEFQERNPQLRVFSAHMHMDEETPHLHIDFVPFTTGSKRGLETRVSLRQALAQQGITGGSKSLTEWNKWIQSEKKELANVMEQYDVKWKEFGTHKPHLSVLDYKKQEREKEVIELEKEVGKIENQISDLKEDQEFYSTTIDKYNQDEEWQVPDPKGMMSASNYKEKIIEPFVKKLKIFVSNVTYAYKELHRQYMSISKQFKSVSNSLYKVKQDNSKLVKETKDYDKIKRAMGKDEINKILKNTKRINNEQLIKPKSFDLERQAELPQGQFKQIKTTCKGVNK